MGRKLTADRHLKEHQIVILAGMFPNPEIVKVFQGNNIANWTSLYSTHEEAETHIILHTLAVEKSCGLKGLIMMS